MSKKSTKYIFVTGGVLSGLGKGITAASIGKLLKARGLKVNLQKCDPYLNVDAGTLNPAEHGECFVTNDGAETDLDLGHYERFIDEELTQSSSLMAGRVIQRVIEDERSGRYKGKTIQYIPQVAQAFQSEIEKAAQGFDVHIAEIGGTVGDYESLSLIEAIREFALKIGKENVLFVHVVYMPYLGASREFKTKPAQNAVRDLRGFGIMPDVLVVRSEAQAPETVKGKLSMFSGVPEAAIALLPNAPSIYEVPLTLEDSGIVSEITDRLGFRVKAPDLSEWREMVARVKKRHAKTVSVGIVAKYMDNQDTYMSVFEALKSGAAWSNVSLDIQWINAERLEGGVDLSQVFEGIDGIVVPGGFGSRAVEGKILAAQHALKNKLPYLGTGLGLQVAVIAAARSGGLVGASSEELSPKEGSQLVVRAISGQVGKEGPSKGTCLGGHKSLIDKSTLVGKIYNTKEVNERHRHRYECSSEYQDRYESWGIRVSGSSQVGSKIEIIEAIDHPFFIATQFHPEFKSRPNRPHPLFKSFIASLK